MQTILSDQVRSSATSGQIIRFDPTECIKIIFGREIQDGDEGMMKQILELLGFEVQKDWNVRIPRWRGSDDMNIAHDMYEEVVRIYGLNRVEPLADKEVISYKPFHGIPKLSRIVEQVLVHTHHADQLQTYPRCDESFFDLFGYDRAN